MKHLIGMTDFLPEHPYSKFLKQALKLWMFVPCDEDGNVLEEPICQEYALANQKYQQAKERCLFKGITRYKICNDGSFHICYNKNQMVIINKKDKIENIVDCDIQLNKTALKQIGL